jgi:hypothetical protein
MDESRLQYAPNDTIEARIAAYIADHPIVSEAFPVGAIYTNITNVNPATELGYGTWATFGAGKVPVGLDAGDPDFDTPEETGGAKTVAAAGTNSAPSFSGNSVTSSAVSGGTPAGTVSQPTFTGNSDTSSAVTAGTPAGTNSVPTFTGGSDTTGATSAGTPAGTVTAPTVTWPVGVPTFTGNSVALASGVAAAQTFTGTPSTDIVNHTHTQTWTQQAQGGTTANNGGTHVMTSTATGGGLRSVETTVSAATANPTGGVASYTPAGTNGTSTVTGTTTATGTVAWPAGVPTNSTPTFTGSALGTHTHSITATGTVSAPVFTGSALGTHTHTTTATGTVSQPTFTGSALGTHTHTTTATGTVSAPTFTGSATSVVQPYIVVCLWRRTA